MLTENKLKAALAAGRPVFGLINAIPAPLLVEMIGCAGYDFVILDLSQSYGMPGDAQHPEVQAAVARVAQACRAHGVPFCAVPRNPGQYPHWRAQGVLAFLLGDDRSIAFRALRQGLAAQRGEAPLSARAPAAPGAPRSGR